MIFNNKKLIVIASIVGVIGLGAMIGFIGQGNVRHVEIFWKEKVERPLFCSTLLPVETMQGH